MTGRPCAKKVSIHHLSINIHLGVNDKRHRRLFCKKIEKISLHHYSSSSSLFWALARVHTTF